MYIWQQKNWSDFSWDNNKLSPVLINIDALHRQLLGEVPVLPDVDMQVQMDALIQSAIRSSEIEGEQLNAESVRSSVARQLGLPAAGYQQGTKQTDAFVTLLLDATQKYEEPVSLQRLCEWQSLLFPDGVGVLNSVKVGELRGDEPMQVVSGRVNSPTVHFEAPPREQLEQELAQFLDWFNDKSNHTDGFIRAGIAHLWLLTLHPFEDGNGRVTRALTDMALAQAEQQSIRFYSLSAAIMNRRKEYYEQLEQAQKGTLDITDWLVWFLSVLEDALVEGRLRLERVLQKSKFWSLHAQTVLLARQIKVLNRLLDAGSGLEIATEFKEGISADKYKNLTKVSKPTATRDLTDLLEKGCLEKLPAGGRSTRYVINYP